jgi:hypothetical protein
MTIDSLIMETLEGRMRLRYLVGLGPRAVFNFEENAREFRGSRGPAKSEDTACGGGWGRGGLVAFGQEDEGGDVAAGAFM